MKKLCIQWMILFVVCSISPFVDAQTAPKRIQMETEREAKVKLSTVINVGGNYQTGNTENGAFALSSAISAMDSIKEFSLNARYNYSENARKMNKNEFSGGVQFDYHPLSRFSPFARLEFYSNKFRQINSRFAGLLGAKYCYFKRYNNNTVTSEFSVSGAFAWELDNYTSETHLPDRDRFRLSIRPKFKQSVTKSIFLGYECFYKPNLDDFKDYIIDSRFQLNFVISNRITLFCSYTYEYDSRPVTSTVKKTDTYLLASLEIKF